MNGRLKVIIILTSVLLLTALAANTTGVSNEDAISTPEVANLRLAPNREGFPDKAITLLVGGNPGGGWDQLARLIQHVLITNEILPVPVEVINRGGAGGTIGLAELVTKHRRDPHIIMIGGSTLVSATISHGSRFSIVDTVPLARVISEYDVIAVPAKSPLESFDELIEQLKADPKSVVWGGGSAAGVDHILVGLIARAAGVDPREITYVAFTGGGEASAAVMGGQVTAGVGGLGEWKDLAEAGLLRLLAISSPSRLDGVDIPTIRESGLDVVLENWRCLVLAPGVRKSEQAWLLEAIVRMRKTDSWSELLQRYRWEDSYLSGAEFEAFLKEDISETAKVLASLGLGDNGGNYAVVGPYAFPSIAVAGTVFFGGLIGWNAWRARRKLLESALGPVVTEQGLDPDDETQMVSWGRFGAGASVSLVYIFLLPIVGFLIATPPFLIAQARVIGSRKLIRDIIASIILTAVVAAAFTYILNVEIP